MDRRIINSFLLACALPGAAAAQSRATSAMPEVVVVTATRSEQALRDYAGSISRVNADYLGLVGSTHHSETINAAPGALIQRNNGQESLTAVRSPVLTGPGSCGAFLFLEDSVPIRPVGFCNVNELFEVNTEQAHAIEVLRGPAGAVYGSSAMHGAINVIPPMPEELPRFGTALEAGPDDYYRAKLAWSTTGNAGDFGATAVVTDDGGWREDSGVREQKLSLAYARELEQGNFSLRLSATNLNQETASFIQGFESYKDEDIARSNPNPEAFRDAYAVRLIGLYETQLNDQWGLQVRPYARTSRMEFLQHFLIGKPLEENGQDSVGVLTSVNYANQRGLDLLLGVDIERADGFLIEDQEGPATGGAPAALAIRPAGKHYDYEVSSTVFAAYAHAEQRLGDRWHLTGSLRGERVEYDYDNRMLTGNTTEAGLPCAFGGCLYSRPADREDTFDYVTPKLGVAFELSESHALYVTAAQGYRAPDTSELYRLQRQQQVADLDAERIDNLEVGLRGTLSSLSYTLAAYTMEKDNVIFRDANAFNVSDGRTKHRGFEYEFGWQIAPQLALSATGTYAKHTYDFNRAVEQGETIVAGRIVDTAPRQVHSARLDWRFIEDAVAQLEWQSVGRYYVDAANANEYEGHDLLNLRVGYSLANDWRVTARLNNVLDERYADRADYAFGNYRYFPGRERTLFVEVSYNVAR